jgi:energy-converting hydrogenase Eha subunit C
MEQSVRSPEKRKSFLRRNLPFVGFLLAMALLGFLAQFQWVGYVVIAVYAAYTFIGRRPARMTFMLALLTLAMVPIAIVLANWLVAQNFAAYSFVLIVLGVIVTIVDLQREARLKK